MASIIRWWTGGSAAREELQRWQELITIWDVSNSRILTNALPSTLEMPDPQMKGWLFLQQGNFK
jgi:hypothetical protein